MCMLSPYRHPSLTLSALRFLSLILSIYRQISGISPGSCMSLMPELKSVLFFSPSVHPLPDPHLVYQQNQLDSILVMLLEKRPSMTKHAPEGSPPTPSLTMIFDLFVDHETLCPCVLWLVSVPGEPKGSGLRSCDTVVCAAAARPITAVTWQVRAGTDATM